MIKYLSKVLLAISILINTLLGGHTNQSFSARNWERKKQNKTNLVWLIDFIFFWEKDHCRESWAKWFVINAAIDYYETNNGYLLDK
jgi:hypothetical protein